ncbi:septum formation family protein [Streptomyces sp. E11-3]|uniref:DUF4190 domain-containing protein n=1 Tax=Streptomyces sp. E11-3 TaxID=3110112 RepID=UPI0039804219
MTFPPPSYGAPPPPYGPPPPHYGTPPPYYGPPAPKVNGFAVASLVLSLVAPIAIALVAVFWVLAALAAMFSLAVLAPLALVFGIVALVQISRNGQRGKGLAVAGVSVSGAMLVLGVMMLAGGLTFSTYSVREEYDSSASPRPEASQSESGERVTVFDLAEGDCFTPKVLPTQENKGSLKNPFARRLPCDEAHRGEIYASFELQDGDGAFPGTEEVTATAREKCGPLLFDYSLDPVRYGGLQTFFYYPDRTGWARGERTVLCWAAKPRGELAVSVRVVKSDLEPAQYAYLAAARPMGDGAVTIPQKGPKEDLAGARKWAGQMGVAYTETVRQLRAAELPSEVSGSVTRLATVLETGVPHWKNAAAAQDAGVFLAEMKLAEGDLRFRAKLDAEIRKGLGLPTPAGAEPGGNPEV